MISPKPIYTTLAQGNLLTSFKVQTVLINGSELTEQVQNPQVPTLGQWESWSGGRKAVSHAEGVQGTLSPRVEDKAKTLNVK